MTETGKRPLDTLSDPDPAIMGLDYRMVEWHHEDGTYSLVQVVSRSEAAAIEAEAVAAHEVVLRERGWMDEYEVETAAAMNFGDGQAAERARIVAGVEATPGVIGHASCIDLTAVLRIIEGETLSD